jgi:hypothetical protein
MTFKKLRCFLLITTYFFIAGCGTKMEPPPSSNPVNFVSATPPGGSTIQTNATITVTFDAAPSDVVVSRVTATTTGQMVTITGPFLRGSAEPGRHWD